MFPLTFLLPPSSATARHQSQAVEKTPCSLWHQVTWLPASWQENPHLAEGTGRQRTPQPSVMRHLSKAAFCWRGFSPAALGKTLNEQEKRSAEKQPIAAAPVQGWVLKMGCQEQRRGLVNQLRPTSSSQHQWPTEVILKELCTAFTWGKQGSGFFFSKSMR